MITWIAFIVLTGQTASVSWPQKPIINPSKQQEMSVDLNTTPKGTEKTPKFSMEMNNGDWKVGNMTGIETNVNVYVPSSTQITFNDEARCRDAIEAILKLPGVSGATCVRTD